MSEDFNPMSTDAMFSKILTRLEEQDRAAEKRENDIKDQLCRIEEQAKITNGRVTDLEHESIKRGAYAAAMGFASALVWDLFFGRK